MSAKTKAANRKIAPAAVDALSAAQRRQRPASDKGDSAAEKNMARRKRLIEQQPENKKAGAHDRKG